MKPGAAQKKSSTSRRIRPIDRRYKPPVKGIDLEQALNYLDLDFAGEDFLYNHYTATRLPYVAGSRPVLERIARRVTRGHRSPVSRCVALAEWVAVRLPWAGHCVKDTGKKLPPDRAATEEELIESGYGWCMEQARVYCALTQVVGIPSRLVFASNNAKAYGHVVSEVFVNGQWLAVDQSFAFCFLMRGKPVRASRIYRDPTARRFFAPAYRATCRRLAEEIGPEGMEGFQMGVAPNPLDGFSDIGYHNYFIGT